MNEGKPSKEQLDYYFKTSRKYFDELAKQYQTTDKEYYDNYIAPYYNNPFVKSGKTVNFKVVLFSFCAVMFIASLTTVFILAKNGVTFKDVFDFKDEPDETEVMYETVTVTEKKVPQTDEKFDTLAISYLKNDLEKGSYYYGVKKYDKAEFYLKRIAKNDNNYLAAQEILKLIEKEKSGKSK
jgi:hypothetical protein